MNINKLRATSIVVPFLQLARLIVLLQSTSQSLIIPQPTKIKLKSALQPRFQSPRLLIAATKNGLSELVDEPDYLITDSADLLDSERPAVTEFIRQSPQEGYVRLPLLLAGTALSLCNIFGNYEEALFAPIVLTCVVLGIANAIGDLSETDISKNIRRGSIDAKVLQVYAGSYTLAVSWLALRVYTTCPSWLPAFDVALGPASSLIFAGSLIFPLLSVLSNVYPDNQPLLIVQLAVVRIVRGNTDIQDLPLFTPTEQFRAIGLLAIGVVACLYLPVTLYLSLYGAAWWDQVLTKFPNQGLLEATTCLFGLIAAQANIIITKAAGKGVRPIGEMVSLGAAASFALAVVPCACALYYLRDDGITFFEHYKYP